MKKAIHIVCILTCTALVLAIVYLGFAFLGNPFSRSIARANAGRYLRQNFNSSDFQVENVGYNLKTGGFYAHIYSPSSEDSHFTIHFDGWGQYTYDTYSNITDRTTTFVRLNGEYRELVRNALPDVNIGYGELRQVGLMEVYPYETKDGSRGHYTLEKGYGIDTASLELDGKYDIRALGADYGHIVLYMEDPELTVEQAAKVLLEVTQHLNNQNIPFRGIDFHLCEPRNENGQYTGNEITLFDFLYTDIREEGLLDRVLTHWDIAKEHYAIQDGIRKYPSETFIKKIKKIENNT